MSRILLLLHLFSFICLFSCTKENEPNLALNYSSLVLFTNDTETLRVTMRDGSVVDPRSVQWESTDPEIVEVGTDGQIVAKQYGEASVRVRYKDLTASCEVVVRPNIYLAGYDMNGGKMGAKYWKNGKEVPLKGNTNARAWARAIYVTDDHVYTAGEISESLGSKAVYWTDQTMTVLPSGSAYAKAYGISVAGNDVYVAGKDGNQAVVWKNGIPTVLAERGEASAITVVHGNVYIAGVEYSEQTVPIATYWVNGQRTMLTETSSSATLNAICVSGSDVYGAGKITEKGKKPAACYWKNGNLVRLTDGSNEAMIDGIAVSGTDVYACGDEWVDGSLPVAKYWKNTTPYSLNGIYALAIALAANTVFITGIDQQNYTSIAKCWEDGKDVPFAPDYADAVPFSIFVK